MVHSMIYHSTVSCHTLTPSMYPSFATTFHSASKCIQSTLLQISSWLRYYVSAIWAWDRVLEWLMFIYLFPYMVLHPSNSMQILVLFVFVWHGVETSKAINFGICSLNLFGYHRKLFIIFLNSFIILSINIVIIVTCYTESYMESDELSCILMASAAYPRKY